MIGKTTAEFYFEGTMQDGSILYEDDDIVVSKVAKVDKPTIQWIKSMQTN